MIADSVYFQGHRCFVTDWSGFHTTKPINVIIGRNNSGKSHLMDLVETLCSKQLIVNELSKSGCRFKARGVLKEPDLKRAFPQQSNPSGILGQSPWGFHGHHFVDVRVEWEFDRDEEPTNIVFPDGFDIGAKIHVASAIGNTDRAAIEHARRQVISDLLKTAKHRLSGNIFRRLLSERDIQAERAETELVLGPSGEGAANVIRQFMVSSSEHLPRNTIQVELRNALNEIFGSDGHFFDILPLQHDENTVEAPKDYWEIYLGEDRKDLIPLSKSGSGLKTLLLVLLNLIAVPAIDRRQKSDFTFVFEELENNLHPALLRRLFKYIEDYAVRERVTIFLTTHSSTALDCFGASANAQIIHVSHNGETARAEAVTAHLGRINVIGQLGARPSDLLQANGIIWVEGPSDRVYINRWIELYTDGAFQEGRHYQCAHYGGALLSQVQFAPSDDANPDLANLFAINPNVVVVCDGDRSNRGAALKKRVRRIFEEVSTAPKGHTWITRAREVENYVPGSILAAALGRRSLPDPEQNEQMFSRKAMAGRSNFERCLGKRSVDKTELAILCAPQMTKEIMKERFDWEAQMKEIVDRVKTWND